MGHQLGLGERRVEAQFSIQPERLRYLLEEGIDALDADSLEHRADVRFGVREVPQ
jgi:hypothetical protein